MASCCQSPLQGAAIELVRRPGLPNGKIAHWGILHTTAPLPWRGEQAAATRYYRDPAHHVQRTARIRVTANPERGMGYGTRPSPAKSLPGLSPSVHGISCHLFVNQAGYTMLPFSPPAGTPMMGVTPSVVPTLPTFSLHTPGPSQLLAESPLAQPIPSLSAPGPCPPAQTAASFTQSDALPPKLKKKILELEFVDMAELIPDTWRWQDDDDSKCCHKPHRTPRRGPVTDILLWVECYATLVSVLTTRFPDKAPELMAYLRAIVHAQRTYYGDGWVTYDACYRRQAAASKTLNWSQINFTLYNEAFTGRANPSSGACTASASTTARQTAEMHQMPHPGSGYCWGGMSWHWTGLQSSCAGCTTTPMETVADTRHANLHISAWILPAAASIHNRNAHATDGGPPDLAPAAQPAGLPAAAPPLPQDPRGCS